ncbi:MAG: universal stress protein [Solirubrobacteraceae bacterium]|nr:universal stress protein [Solirubrobacteraceae bacterium]
MAIVVAVRPGHRNAAALAWAGVLAASIDEPVVAAAVVLVPAGVPSPLRDGMADADFFDLIAVDAFDEARAALGDALTATVAIGARSVRAGLLDLLERRGATHLVLGSADGGTPGRTRVGDVASALLHAATVPVHLAPVGYPGSGIDVGSTSAPSDGSGSNEALGRGEASVAPRSIRRVTVAFGSGDGSRQALELGARLADRADSMLRVATFFIRGNGSASLIASQGYGAQIATAWREQMEGTLDGAIRGLASLGLPTRFVSADFGDGATWRDALGAIDWVPGELLIVGSRPRGGPIRTFLGSSAAEILGESTVPVMVLPS